MIAPALVITLIASLVGGLGSNWLVNALLGVGWFIVAGAYFVVFWTTVGQTPGLRMMRLRVVDGKGESPSAGRSVVRLIGLALAGIPLFAGFLPVLLDAAPPRAAGLPRGHRRGRRSVLIWSDAPKARYSNRWDGRRR